VSVELCDFYYLLLAFLTESNHRPHYTQTKLYYRKFTNITQFILYITSLIFIYNVVVIFVCFCIRSNSFRAMVIVYIYIIHRRPKSYRSIRCENVSRTRFKRPTVLTFKLEVVELCLPMKTIQLVLLNE